MFQAPIYIDLTHAPGGEPFSMQIERIHAIDCSPPPPQGPFPTFRVIRTFLNTLVQNQNKELIVPDQTICVKETVSEIKQKINEAVKERASIFKKALDEYPGGDFGQPDDSELEES